MKLTLKIVPARRAQHQTVAWLIHGSDPQAWVNELSQWNVPFESLRLRVIPHSMQNPAPIGVLVTVKSPDGTVEDLSGDLKRGIPFGCVARRLYVPADAMLFPAVSDAELTDLLPNDDSDFVWHAATGLVRYEESDRLRIVDLIERPLVTPSRWDRAIPGISFQSRLISVEPAESPSFEEILRNASDGIGTDQRRLDELPPSPDEGLGGKLYQWTKPLWNAWKSLRKPSQSKPQPAPGSAASGPAGSRPPSAGAGGLMGWLGSVVGPLSSLAASTANVMGNMIPQSIIDRAARHREIDRLLNLLKDDPDAGLRYALPMGGTAAPRGLGAAGNELVPRDMSFGLGKLFGSQAVDPWDVPPDQQFQLIQRYRELATREIQMGRHRRAAYIYAELLGDLQGAANALEAGHHYREAAVLYREKLKRPADAARCLEQGGLLDEAAEIYIELGMMENAADLYRRLQRHDEADQLLRNWATQLQRDGHYMRASEVWHLKLNDVDQALVVLDDAWKRDAAGAEACLKQTFTLIGQSSQHDAASRQIAVLRDATESDQRVQMIARILSSVANDYVDANVRDAAGDATRVVVARQLPKSIPAESSQLLSRIRILAPEDRLLSRDCDRFVQQQQIALQKKSLSKSRRTRGVSPIRLFVLEGRENRWLAAKSNSEALYLIAYTTYGLMLRRVPWSNPQVSNQNAYWANISDTHRIVFDVPRTPSQQILVHAVGAEPLGLRGLLTESVRPESAGSPVWASNTAMAMAYNDGGPFAWRVRAAFGVVELSGFGPKGDEVTTGVLRLEISADQLLSVPVSICAAAQVIRIGIGNFICRPQFRSSEGTEAQHTPFRADSFIQLDGEITSLDNFRDQYRQGAVDCVVALFDVGGVVITEPIHENQPQSFAEGIENPRGTFLTDGRYVVAGRNECRVYRFEETSIQLVGQTPLDAPAVSVVRTQAVGEFAVITADSRVRIYSTT